MAITLVGSHAEWQESLDPFVATTGIAVQPGDVVLVAANIRNTGTGTLFTGWQDGAGTTAVIGSYTTLYSSPAAAGFQPDVTCGWARVIDAGNFFAGANVTGTRTGTLFVAVFRGLNDTPFGTVNEDRGVSSTPSTSSITPTEAGQWVVSLTCVYGGDYQTVTGTSTWTEIELSTNLQSARLLAEYKVAADNSTPLAAAPTLWTSTDWSTSNILLRAAPEVVPGTTVGRGLYL